MAQKKEQIRPLFLNTDLAFSELKPFHTPYLRGLTFDISSNPISNIGTNNPTGEGQNELIQSTIRSNIEVPGVLLPDGYNKHIGEYESTTTQELYHFNFNGNSDHGIYVLGGNTGIWQKVVIDKELQFTDNQESFIKGHRVFLRFIKDGKGNIIEKYLLLTDGNSWHKYINVIAAIKTNGFDSSLYPYWNLKPPHFDRRELLEWPVRPPMVKPIVTPIANTNADKGKLNRFVDKGFQIAIAFQNTDGRQSTLSPFSLPILIKSEDFLSNPDNIPKNVKVNLPAGSPLTEKILFYVRSAKKGVNTLPSITEWTDWFLYDTIKKFPNSNSSDVLGTDYWLRTNPFAAFNYDGTFNTIEYTFDLSKTQQLVNQEDANMLETGMPQLSIGMGDLGDAAILGDNRYGYPNFGDDVMDNIDAEVVEKENSSCQVSLRKIRLYAYIARMGDDFTYISQVGNFNGDTDKQMRFGGLFMTKGSGNSIKAFADGDESRFYQLDFADKNAFRCYLKGTPYYADGTWYKVNSDNSLVKLTELLDFSKVADIDAAGEVFKAQGYYVCVFDIVAPADKYIACLGRHNVASSGDYRNTSTYVYGIANSRVKSSTIIPNTSQSITSIKPNAINDLNGQLFSKEMEIDCTSGDIDVWGNNHDLFYVYCPHIHKDDHLDVLNLRGDHYRFIEGYFKEDVTNPIPVEMWPYSMTHGAGYDYGKLTDKNGFYWAYTQVKKADTIDIRVDCKLNCSYPVTFTIATSATGIGWMQNAVNYLADHNGGVVGTANRILYYGRITSLDGSLGYSNISISIKDGATVSTDANGRFTLIIHNGWPFNRVDNVYVNAGGNFFITIADCGQVPLFNFNESLVPCSLTPTGINQCTGESISARTYPICLTLAVKINTDRQTSVKEGGKYNISIHGADLAGRLMYENVVKEITVPSFLERLPNGNLKATFFRLLINSLINFADYPDIKWVAPSVTKNLSVKRYIEWVGDEIQYIDNNGQIVKDASSAVFVSIKINSLINSNIAKNLSLLSSYEFVKGDRLRIYDDGDGHLLDVATYGDPIDLQIEGTNYLQVAINAGLLKPSTNTVLSTNDVTAPDVVLIVKYDPRLDKLIDKKGFWIEMYTPTEQSDINFFYEVGGFYPIIKNTIAEFTGYSNGQPTYKYLTSIDIDFWDTYFFDRTITIPGVGNKYFSHPFQSPNVTDNWGADILSGGRVMIKNDNAKQYWLPTETIKSDGFLNEGLINGLATFRSDNKKNFRLFNYGGIVAIHAEGNIIAFCCENNWFITDFNYHYAFANEQGVMVANLDDGLSTPHQKIGSIFGISKADTGTFLFYDKEIYWYDRKNTAHVRMNYRDAIDTSVKSESEQGGMQSYFNTKSDFITSWNNAHTKENSFDVISGIDVELGKIYITFRPRRNNSNEISSYINDRRSWQLNFQETLVYDTINRGWLRAEGFTPEGYGSLRGDATGTQLISFAAGKPYLHNSEKNSFNKYYGIQTQPILIGCFNDLNTTEKVYDLIYYGGNPSGWFIDEIYTDFKNSFSYLSSNKFKKFLNNFYAATETNANAYPSNNPDFLFESMFISGYKMRGKYFIFRLVANYTELNSYKEIGTLTGVTSIDDSNSK